MVLLSVGVISAAYAIRTVGQLFTGPVRSHMKEIEDLRPMEMLAAGSLTAGIILLGIYPAPVLDIFSSSVALLSQTFAGHL